MSSALYISPSPLAVELRKTAAARVIVYLMWTVAAVVVQLDR